MRKKRGARAKLRPIHINLRRHRERIGLTQEEVAARVGELAGGASLTPSAVSRWERGKSTPSGEHLPHVAAVLGVTIDALYGARP